MRRFAIFAILLALALALPASAHSRAEIEAYETDWHQRLVEADNDGQPIVGLLEERRDFMLRHPWYWSPPAPVTRSSPPPRPSGVNRGVGGNVEQWRGLVAEYFGGEVERALCVVAWESGGNPNAASPSNDHGLFQIHAPLWTNHFGVSISQLYDPETNTRLAKTIRDSGGWQMWSAIKRGKC